MTTYLTKYSTLKTQQLKKSPILKWTKNMKRHYTEEEIHMNNKHMKGCSASLLGKQKLNSQQDYIAQLFRIPKIKNDTTKCLYGHEETKSLL